VAQRRESTSTSTFGVGRRESHDASGFYSRFATPEIVADDDLDPGVDRAIDTIVCGDARDMTRVPDRCVALVVTSPPYFAGKEYEQALSREGQPGTYLEYLRMLEEVFAECVRTLEPGGRIAVNVANLGRKPYRSLAADVITILQDRLRLLLRGEVIWQKARGSTGSCAWGSFQSPANPVLRDLTERVIIAGKGRFDRALDPRRRRDLGLPHETSLSRDEFMEATTDVWEIPSERATRVGHPAPFPVELPARFIHLYTYRGDLVLDPFAGSGTTAIAALRTGRHYVGYDTDPEYVGRAEERIAEERERLAGGATPGVYDFRIPPAERAKRRTSRDGSSEDTTADDHDMPASEAARRAGLSAKDVARALLADAGFAEVDDRVRVRSGVTADLRGIDRSGRPWLFLVCGAFTSVRSGLDRGDVLWRALGRAAVIHEAEPKVPLVLLAAGVPSRSGAFTAAVHSLCGPEKPVTAVVDLLGRDPLGRLREIAHADPLDA